MICTSERSHLALLENVTLPPRLQKELDELKSDYQIEVSEEGDWINLVFAAFPLGQGFSPTTSDLLLRIPRSYPDAGPDMFWLDPSVKLSTGQVPQSAESLELCMGRNWRRFSWHRKAWSPSIDNTHGYLEFIRRRLRENR